MTQATPPGSEDHTLSYGSPMAATSKLALTSMILGIASLPLGCLIIGVPIGWVALVLGIVALVKINRQPLKIGGRGFAITGIVTGALAGVMVIPILISILLPSSGKSHELSNRAVCAANLRGLAQSMNVYAADNGDAFPLVRPPVGGMTYTPLGETSPGGRGVSLEAALTDAEFKGTVNQGSVNASIFILAPKGYMAAKQFICKSDPAAGTPAATTSPGAFYLNFNAPTMVEAAKASSYSFAYPWTPDGKVGVWWRSDSDADLPIAADMAPLSGSGAPAADPAATGSAGTTKLANSNNHQRDGQNVAYADAHAEFERRPDVGQHNDNIWTSFGASPASARTGTAQTTAGSVTNFVGGKAGAYDIVMVPTASLTTSVRQ